MRLFLLLTVILDHQQYWVHFYNSCKEWIAYWASTNKIGKPCHFPEIVEGKNFSYGQLKPANWSTQFANLFRIVTRKTGLSVPLPLISISCLAIYLMALFCWWKSRAVKLSDGIMMGMILYWLFEICSPIPKTTYYHTELFIVALFMAAVFKQAHPLARILFVFSLLLLFTFSIPAKLILSEMFLMTSLAIYLITKYHKGHPKKNHPTEQPGGDYIKVIL